MRRVSLLSVARPALPYFPTLSHKRHDLKKILLNIKPVFWFSLQLLSETFLIPRKIQRDFIINVHRSSRKLPIILVTCQWNLHFLDGCLKNFHILNFIKIPPVGAEFFHMDRRTDRYDEANCLFYNFAKAPKNIKASYSSSMVKFQYKYQFKS
jgi:hypothetical protein